MYTYYLALSYVVGISYLVKLPTRYFTKFLMKNLVNNQKSYFRKIA